MRSKNVQVSIMVVCLIVGVMLSLQFRTSENYGMDLRGSRVDDLTIKLNTVTEERDSLVNEVASLREKLANVRNNDKAMADLQEELQKAQMSAGFLPVQGPGIIVTLDDSPLSVQPGGNPADLLVHDEDLLKVVNEMKASGAEAIAINGERITAMSEIRCAGTTILVNWNKIAPPYTIKAVGDPQMLESGLNIKNGCLDQLKLWGIQVQMEKKQEIAIPSYNGPFQFKYGTPINNPIKETAEK